MTQPLTRLRDALRLGVLCLALGVLGWAWELLARQAPSSPWHVMGFPSAIDRFALRAWIEGLVIVSLAPRAFSLGLGDSPRRARAVLLAAYGGTVLALGSLAISAATGVLGMQIRDASSFSRGLLLARLVGDGLLLLSLWVAVRVNLSSER